MKRVAALTDSRSRVARARSHRPRPGAATAPESGDSTGWSPGPLACSSHFRVRRPGRPGLAGESQRSSPRRRNGKGRGDGLAEVGGLQVGWQPEGQLIDEGLAGVEIPLMEHRACSSTERIPGLVSASGCRPGNVSVPPGRGEIGAKGQGGHLARAGIEQVQGICQRVRLRLWALTRWMLTRPTANWRSSVCRLRSSSRCSPSASMTSSQSRSLAPATARPRQGRPAPAWRRASSSQQPIRGEQAQHEDLGLLHLDRGRRRASLRRRCPAAARGRRGRGASEARAGSGVSACSGAFAEGVVCGGLARSRARLCKASLCPGSRRRALR